MNPKKPHFSGYATKNDIKCSDGLTIRQDSFKHNDGSVVPLVWRHQHDTPTNILGHARLENRADGVYVYGYFNDGTEQGKNARALVEHGDVNALSIYANQLVKQGQDVLHGQIREVSLVLAGANPGARIENVYLEHEDSLELLEDEVVLAMGLEIRHEDSTDTKEEEKVATANETKEDKTVEEVFNSLSEEQKNVVYFMIGQALENEEGGSDSDDAEHEYYDKDDLQHEEGYMSRNVFDQNEDNLQHDDADEYVLKHDDVKYIMKRAVKTGSVKEAVEDFAIAHGIEMIDILFPDAKAISNTPEFLNRRTEWVDLVLKGTNHTPFAKIKNVFADISLDEARAKGYVKGNMKKEEFFRLSKRETTPQTVYKKQKMDRDDIIDITSFDVLAWLKAEMRIKLDEEIARAILIGDGRDVDDDDKIREDKIRPIASDNDLFSVTININLDDADSSADEIIDAILAQRYKYRGSGTPSFFVSEAILGKLVTAKDGLGRRLYKSTEEIASVLRVKEIVPVEVFEEVDDLVGIMVNLTDYNVGTDKGGEVNFFDDFDLDYNAQKFLIETRLSGALVKAKSALVIRKVAQNSTLVTPEKPIQDDNEVLIPTVAGVKYRNKETAADLTDGSTVTLSNGDTLVVEAVPASAEYYFATNDEDEWTFTYRTVEP